MTGKKRFASKSVILLLVLICIVVLVGLLSQFKLQSSTEFSYNHDLIEYPLIKNNNKIAFLFLVRDNLPLDFLWHNFFKNADPENFTIYVHSKPGILFDKSVTKSAFF